MTSEVSRLEAPKYAWITLLVLAILSLWIGLGDFFRAGSGDPALTETILGTPWSELKVMSPRIVSLVDLLSMILGAWLTGFSILAITISAVPFRRGERWAWYALWALPLAYILVFVAVFTADRLPGSPTPPAIFSAPALFVLSSGALLLSVRHFFPRVPNRSGDSGAKAA